MKFDNDFSVKLPVFEGPFDLLLFFIEKDELDIHNIPISKITDDFLDYIHQLNQLNLEVASEFIIIAATLMKIKAKTLLPRPDLNEHGEDIDSKQDLVDRLLQYKRFKELSEHFKALEDFRFYKEKRGNIDTDLKRIFSKQIVVEDISEISLYKLMKVYERLSLSYDNKNAEIKHRVEKYPYSIDEQKNQIARLLTLNSRLSFKDVAAISSNKVQFVYNFLAVLELLQQQLAELEAGSGFNNFYIQQPKAHSR